MVIWATASLNQATHIFQRGIYRPASMELGAIMHFNLVLVCTGLQESQDVSLCSSLMIDAKKNECSDAKKKVEEL